MTQKQYKRTRKILLNVARDWAAEMATAAKRGDTNHAFLMAGLAAKAMRNVREVERARFSTLEEPLAAEVIVRGGAAEKMLAEKREIELQEFIADCKRAATPKTTE